MLEHIFHYVSLLVRHLNSLMDDNEVSNMVPKHFGASLQRVLLNPPPKKICIWAIHSMVQLLDVANSFMRETIAIHYTKSWKARTKQIFAKELWRLKQKTGWLLPQPTNTLQCGE